MAASANSLIICGACSEKFLSLPSLLSHVRCYHLRWVFQCIYCRDLQKEVKKPSDTELEDHIRTIHPGMPVKILFEKDVEMEKQMQIIMAKSVVSNVAQPIRARPQPADLRVAVTPETETDAPLIQLNSSTEQLVSETTAQVSQSNGEHPPELCYSTDTGTAMSSGLRTAQNVAGSDASCTNQTPYAPISGVGSVTGSGAMRAINLPFLSPTYELCNSVGRMGGIGRGVSVSSDRRSPMLLTVPAMNQADANSINGQPTLSSQRCKNCYEQDHELDQCPYPRFCCRKCKQVGHIFRNCPERQTTCHFCQSSEHTVAECQELARKVCTQCKGVGHTAKHCKKRGNLQNDMVDDE